MAGFFAFAMLYGIVIQARPFATDDYGTVEKGVVELELGTDYFLDRNASTYLAVKHGLTNRAELDLAFSYDYPGISPLGISFKINVLEYKKIHYTMNFDIEPGSPAFDMNNIVTLSLKDLEVNANISTYNGFSTVETGISPIYTITDYVDIGCEGRYSFDNTYIVGAGLIVHPLENINLDVGISYTGDSAQTRISVTSGLVVDF